MNYKMMAYILGNIMQAEGLLMSISALLALYKGEINELRAFLITIILLLVIGTAMKHFAPKNKKDLWQRRLCHRCSFLDRYVHFRGNAFLPQRCH